MSGGVWGMEIQAAAAFIGLGMGGVAVTWSGRCNWQHLWGNVNLGRRSESLGMRGGYSATRDSGSGPVLEKNVSLASSSRS
jgi:hypothetical protein